MFKNSVGVIAWTAIFAFILLILPANKVQAYLDPGSSSLIIQVLIGGILGLLVAGKLFWGRITGFITGKKSPEKAASSDNEEEQNQVPGSNQS